ncbi:3-hydroxyanthranilic acid dioxygenase [Knufia peltigerae]|uniref:3-hydroxyanthranilate 3,4-dioxygenase n=1 Tax=Knufia peltigerae TaxID=1002370 RepID=A0AA39CUW1_9EURO|nr:3-hydroxyanthranilic acid dioxygenase [Knufia peltigerae]
MAAAAALPSMPRAIPLDLGKWIAANNDKLQPPVSNYCLYSGEDFTLMIVGGPNSRNDFHVNETEELFYQIKGDMTLRLVDHGEIRDMTIKEGEMFLVPGNTPHSPIRYADTYGLVMERRRPEGSVDRLQWYCSKGHHDKLTMIREDSFHCTDLGKQLVAPINAWKSDENNRRCPECGQVEDPQ